MAKRDGLEKVLAWPLAHRGLWVGGESRLGKSRACHEALRAVFMAGKSVRIIDGIEFAETASSMARESKLDAWVKREFLKPAVVYIDDWGKVLGEPMGRATHLLLELRSKRQRPCWFSSQLAPNVIRAGLPAHLADSVLGRRDEFCGLVVV